MQNRDTTKAFAVKLASRLLEFINAALTQVPVGSTA